MAVIEKKGTKKPDLARLLYGMDEGVSVWVSDRIPECSESGFDDARAIGVMSDDGKRLIAGVVYTDYQPACKTIQLHIAADSPMWARKEFITELLAYPFLQLGVFKCWVMIAAHNRRSLNTTEHIGFASEALLPHQFGEEKHAVIKGMTRPDYIKRYIK